TSGARRLRRPRAGLSFCPVRACLTSRFPHWTWVSRWLSTRTVFGWNIRGRDSDRPSFDDATGNVSGAWVTGRAIGREPGLLPYIWVDSIDATLALVASHSGEVEGRPFSPGGNFWIATFRDPARNAIGLYQEGPR